jgi:hypothetical protein
MPFVTINKRQVDFHRLLPEGTNSGGSSEKEKLKTAVAQGDIESSTKIIQNIGGFGISSDPTIEEIQYIERIDLHVLGDVGFNEKYKNAYLDSVHVSNHLYTVFYVVSQFFEFDKNRTRETKEHFTFSIGEADELNLKSRSGSIRKVGSNDIAI